MLSDSLNKAEPETDQTVQLVFSRLLSPTECLYILACLQCKPGTCISLNILFDLVIPFEQGSDGACFWTLMVDI